MGDAMPGEPSIVAGVMRQQTGLKDALTAKCIRAQEPEHRQGTVSGLVLVEDDLNRQNINNSQPLPYK